jgi:hypothetical protein
MRTDSDRNRPVLIRLSPELFYAYGRVGYAVLDTTIVLAVGDFPDRAEDWLFHPEPLPHEIVFSSSQTPVTNITRLLQAVIENGDTWHLSIDTDWDVHLSFADSSRAVYYKMLL